jgi:septum site-determining protein MinD
MGKVIVVTSGKGGVGKTTTTANVGGALTKLGKRVLLVDMDVGLRNLDLVMGLENRVVYTFMDVLEGRCTAEQAMVREKHANGALMLLAASQLHNKQDLDLDRVKEAIATLAEEFDYVFLDSPAGIEHGFDASSAPAGQALVVVTPDVTSVRDADRVIGLLENKGVRDCRLIVNKYDRTLIERKKQLTSEDIVDVLGTELAGIVPDDKAIIDATNRGEILVLSQNTPAAAAYLEIARRLEGEEVRFAALSTGRSLLGLFRRQK